MNYNAELRAIAAALRKHAREAIELADKISKLAQTNPEPTGLTDPAEPENIHAFLLKAHEKFPNVPIAIVSRLTSALSCAEMDTPTRLREEIAVHGRPRKPFSHSSRFWLRIPNLGTKTGDFLADVVEEYNL